ncbi:MAG: hypothetical protein ACP5VP_10325 [Candidatus Limnocylindrales bacterium]
MIIVLGRPRAARPTQQQAAAAVAPAGLCVAIARAVVAAEARVELVGSIGDDAVGDAVIVGLAREEIGHAAMLRTPGSSTPGGPGDPGALPPRLDREDVALGLGYLVDFEVLVLAEPLDPAAEEEALDAASYRGARIVAVVPPGSAPSGRLAAAATVFEAPEDAGGAFAVMVGRYAVELERGMGPGEAFARAVAVSGWERRP